ncbi:Protein trichome birefringence-like [Quillaja saponaria]|uniref:Protein trichome birefringence-like n=1 Tax=Quillaja saponaria TaxID=32244 RepID=A0AAD7PRB2_QUISA|nr:Protein trichome birefringence-like [Quillaja saponaria]
MALLVSQSSCYLLGSCLALLFLVFLQTHLASPAVIMSSRNNHNHHHHHRPMIKGHANQSTCALFAGTWVRDEAYPIYQSSSCPIIDPEFNCQMYGRPDSDYLKYRWKPLNCELPRFDGLDFLLKMRGKTVMFVGDSLGRNQWESLICMISASAPGTQTQLVRGDPLSAFKFLEYGHWWSHKGSLQGWNYMELEGKYYQDMDRLAALEKGLRTWSNWVDSNIDRSRTRVFFQAISPTHYNQAEWNAGATTTNIKNCYGETAPVTGITYPGVYPEQMRVVNTVIREMHHPAYLLDITMLSELRKDGHPSIYSGDLSPEQRAYPDHRSADCSHWCLPGLPDTWNELFYTALFY